jgi:hypothetical protein
VRLRLPGYELGSGVVLVGAFLSLPTLRSALALLHVAHAGLARLVMSLHLPGSVVGLDETSWLCDSYRVWQNLLI